MFPQKPSSLSAVSSTVAVFAKVDDITGNAKTIWRATPKHRTPDASLNLFWHVRLAEREDRDGGLLDGD